MHWLASDQLQFSIMHTHNFYSRLSNSLQLVLNTRP